MNSTELLNSKKTRKEDNLKTHLSNSSMISAEVGAVTSSCQTTGMSPLRLIGSGDKFKNFPVQRSVQPDSPQHRLKIYG